MSLFVQTFLTCKGISACKTFHYKATCKLKTVKLFFQLPVAPFLNWLILTDKDVFPLRWTVLFVVILSLPGGTAPQIHREYTDAVYRHNHMLTSN